MKNVKQLLIELIKSGEVFPGPLPDSTGIAVTIDGETRVITMNTALYVSLVDEPVSVPGPTFLARVNMGNDGFVLDAVMSRDGSQWCALVDDNLQVGVAGFGFTVGEAIGDLKTNIRNERAK